MNDDPQTIATEVNGSISTAAKRQNGLLKMALFLENCKSNQERDILEHNCSFWIKTLFQIFENHPVSLHAKLAHYCFYLLIQNSKNLSADISRLISTSFIEKSIILLTSSSEILSKNALICLNELMSCYRSSCSQYKQRIENYVIHKLESDSDDIIEYASMCYAKLPYLHKNTNNMDVWYSYFKIMMKNLNIILNELFDEYQINVHIESNEHETMEQSDILNAATATASSSAAATTSASNSYSGKSEKIFTKLNKDVENLEYYYKKSLRRFKACTLAIGNLLTPLNEEVVIKIRPNEIIEFLRRVYFFDFKKLIQNSRISNEARCLINIIAGLINSTIRFTIKFFEISETNLLTYGNTVSYMLSHFSSFINEKFLFKCISNCFDCITHWMVTNGPSCGLYKYSLGLIDLLLENIKPNSRNILSLDNKSRNKSQNSRDIHKQTCNQLNLYFDEKTTLNNHQLEAQNKIIGSALNCLREYIKNFSHKLSYSQFEKIQQTIIDILLSIQHNYHLRKPYDQNICRLGLYENLFELCLTQNVKISPPLSVSISLFRNGLNDTSNEIKGFAQQSLNVLRAFTYPVLPIYFKEYQIQANNVAISQEQQINIETNANKDQQQSVFSSFFNTPSLQINGTTSNNSDNNLYDQKRETLSVKKLSYKDNMPNMSTFDHDMNEACSLKRKNSIENGVDEHYENSNNMTKKLQNESNINQVNNKDSQYLKYNKILNNQINKVKSINNENSKQDSNGNEEYEEIISDEDDLDEEEEEEYDDDDEIDEENEEDEEDEFDDAQNEHDKNGKEDEEIEDEDEDEEDDEDDIVEEEIIEEAIECEKALLNPNNIQENKGIEMSNTSKKDENFKISEENDHEMSEEKDELPSEEVQNKDLIKKLVNESYAEEDDEEEDNDEVVLEDDDEESEGVTNSSNSRGVDEKMYDNATLDKQTEMTVNKEIKNSKSPINIELLAEVTEKGLNQEIKEINNEEINTENKKDEIYVEPKNLTSQETPAKVINFEENRFSVETLNKDNEENEMAENGEASFKEICMKLNVDAVKND